ncbi:MAG TPA: GNAT family N-acetyltransferase [Ruminococcus sp.]|nr:GNAT family N-acetyltransferase [Ruminococcus sp.]
MNCGRKANNLLIRALSADSPEWAALADYAETASWRAGAFLARCMRENRFAGWERVFAACSGDTPVGFCTLTARDELPESCAYTPFIGFVYVDPAYRGRRISAEMIAAASDYARSLGYRTVYITSDEQGLYEKFGFTKRGNVRTSRGDMTQLFAKPLE